MCFHNVFFVIDKQFYFYRVDYQIYLTWICHSEKCKPGKGLEIHFQNYEGILHYVLFEPGTNRSGKGVVELLMQKGKTLYCIAVGDSSLY